MLWRGIQKARDETPIAAPQAKEESQRERANARDESAQ